ncbi:MAG TPA: hypothetical protein VFI52_07940 [Gemmatimonadaceae bacterium]|nr:hypothetical protein [Gemmatimonadaceae bacterium]
MRACSGRTAIVAGILMGAIGLGTTAGAQESTPAKADSAPHFALFGGWAPIDGMDVMKRGFAMGASGDFRLSPIPVPLRFSLSFDERGGEYVSKQRGGQASLDLVMRPIPKRFGVRPYFLGGLGVATQMGYMGWGRYTVYTPDGALTPTFYNYFQPRQTWAFASVGMGLDVGRAFIQMKLDQPIASQGPVLVPISVGFRFWD